MGIERTLFDAWELLKAKVELLRLRWKYGSGFPRPRGPVRRLRPWDVPLLEHYLWQRARAAGRELPWPPYAWPPREPDPVWEVYWAAVQRHLRPGMVVAELAPGHGFFTDRFVEDCAEAWLVDYSELLCHQLLPHKYGDRPKVHLCLARDGRFPGVPDEGVDLFFSLASVVHMDIETQYGYLREGMRILRPGGVVVWQYASMVGDEAFEDFLRWCPPDFAGHSIRFQHPLAVENLARRLGYEVIAHEVESARFCSFLHLQKPRKG